MTWNNMAVRVSRRSGESRAATERVLEALLQEITLALVEGESVNLPRVGRLSSAWRDSRTLRAVGDGRKLMLDGRFVPRFRPSKTLRERLAGRTPQLWRSPEHQKAWRIAETLIGDLALYHPDQIPRTLTPSDPPDQVERLCAGAFGPAWDRAVGTFVSRAPEAPTEPYLALAARRRWAQT